MKLLFLTTTAIALGSFSTSSAQVYSGEALSEAQFTQLASVVQTSAVATGLHTGDFQANTKAASAQHLYKGDGASLMTTMRWLKD